MPLPISDYALISDCFSGALVGRDGSIDWLCLPRYDSASMFGALLGDENHGRWLLAPSDRHATSTREYHRGTLVLRTRWTTKTGTVEVTDLMPTGDHRADIVRRVHGIEGEVEMREDVRFRFNYADAMPWVRKLPDFSPPPLVAIAGPDAVILRGPELSATDLSHTATFTVRKGDTIDLSLTWYPAHREPPEALDCESRIDGTIDWWRDWSQRADPKGPYEEQVIASLMMLRALTHAETGGIVAAATTSLPEQFGGSRNWDYRYVWLRDASLTIQVLLDHGYREEVGAWRDWLLRAVAGDPSDLQIMYGLAGERDLAERELTSLPGYQGAAPVRVGNAASLQFQSDAVGEVMVALHAARHRGIAETSFSWSLQRALLGYLESVWEKPDRGIWEMRGDPKPFVHSRVMVWAAFDRAVKGVTESGLDGPVERWTSLRDRVRAEIEEKGVDPATGGFVQYYGTTEVDAALLQLPQVGFCAADDPRMLATVRALEDQLMTDGLLLRYRTTAGVDGLAAGENPFLTCSFWLVEQYANSDRVDDATLLMEKLLGLANDVGMVSEEYDVKNGRQAGNTPQALSHLSLVLASDALARAQRRVGQEL